MICMISSRRHVPWAALAVGISAVCLILLLAPPLTDELTEDRRSALWNGYKKLYIEDGRVIRPNNGEDTVSEGQAYAMLRAIWMNDPEIFDRCYEWTEKNLSRKNAGKDNLLAWNYTGPNEETPGVIDWNAASDADLDYALALLAASRKWKTRNPKGLNSYRDKAVLLIADIKSKEVVSLPDGELVLTPWPIEGEAAWPVVVNPSYFSPAHYRAFFHETGDPFWKKMIDDTYSQLDRIAKMLGDAPGAGLIPDWCEMDGNGRFLPSSDHGTVCSWDAFRVWWRLALDWRIYREDRARDLIRKNLVPFLRKQMESKTGKIFAEYDYSGRALKEYSSPGIIGVYVWVLEDIDPDLSRALKADLDKFFFDDDGVGYYGQRTSYYDNSWAWYGESPGDPSDSLALPMEKTPQ